MSDQPAASPGGSIPLQPTRVAQNTSWNIADLVVSLVVGTITGMVVARWFGPTIMGKYQFVVWMASIVSTLSLYGVPIAASRNIGQYLAAGELGLAGAILRKTFMVQSAIAALAFAAGMVLVFTKLPPDERTWGVVAFVAILPSLFMAIPTAVNALDDRFRQNVIPSIVAAVLECTGVVLVVVFDLGLLGLASSSLLARTVDCTLRSTWAWPRMRGLLRQATVLPPQANAMFMRMAREAAAMQLLAFAVWNRSEILFLEWLSTSEQIAFFSVAYTLSTRVGMLPIASARTFTPAILRTHGVDATSSVAITARSVRVQALLGYPLFGALVVCAPPLVALLYGHQYLPAIPAVMVLAAATAFPIGRSSIEALLRAADRQREMLVLYGVMTVVTLLLDWILIAWFDAVGAAMANGAILVLQGLALFVLARRVTTLRWRDLSLGQPLLITAAASGAAWLATTWAPPLLAIVLRPAIVIALFVAGMALLGAFRPDERVAMAQLAGAVRTRLRTHLSRET